MDINVYLISIEQREVLINFQSDWIKFNPFQDNNGSYFVSQNTFDFVNNIVDCPTDLLFIKELLSSVYDPKIETEL